MLSRVSFIQDRIALNLAESGTTVVVLWSHITGGAYDPTTGGTIGGTRAPMSGTMPAFGLTEPPKSVVRQFAEIQMGDLILDCAVDPQVALFTGQMQSGTVPLADLKNKSPRFKFGDEIYAQKKIGNSLARSWDVIAGNVKLYQTLLLERVV